MAEKIEYCMKVDTSVHTPAECAEMKGIGKGIGKAIGKEL